MRSSEDGSEGSGATGGGSTNYKERGEFSVVIIKVRNSYTQ